MKNIILTGAQGTGKTTVLNMFKENTDYNVITEVVRNLSKKGIKINEQGNEEGQKTIFNCYLDTFNEHQNDLCSNWISDRGLTDVLSYSYYHYTKGDLSLDEMNWEIYQLCKFNKSNPNILYVYFPIEFDVVDDGVRSIDPEYRKNIDSYIKKILDLAHINYITVTGTPQERYDYIMKHAD